MFSDPQTVIGAIIGLLIVVVGTTLGVLGHRRQERNARDERSGR
jgi:hypothetical protein